MNQDNNHENNHHGGSRDKTGRGKSAPEKPGQEKLPLRKYLDDLLDSLRDLIPHAISGDEHAVHDARVATRRLKAATDLLKPVLSDKLLNSFRKTLKNLRQSLGPLRDADVMLDHTRGWLAGVKKENLAHPKSTAAHPPRSAAMEPALKWFVAQLQEQRSGALRDVAADIDASRELSKLGKWWGLRGQLAGKRSNVEGLLSESLQRQFSQFARQADDLADQTLGSPAEGGKPRAHPSPRAAASDDSSSAPSSPPPDSSHQSLDPHALRISGKLLRYTLEMAAAEGWPLPNSVAKSFKEVQQALGMWHDWVVLAQQVMRHSVNAELAYHDMPLQQQLLSLSQAALRRADMQLAVMSRLWRRRGESLRQAIFRVLPTSNTAKDNPPEDNPPDAATPQTASPVATDSDSPGEPDSTSPNLEAVAERDIEEVELSLDEPESIETAAEAATQEIPTSGE